MVFTYGIACDTGRRHREGGKNVMTLESANKESVGQFAANVRRVKPPEPYLGKGMHYEGEVVRRKQGKGRLSNVV